MADTKTLLTGMYGVGWFCNRECGVVCDKHIIPFRVKGTFLKIVVRAGMPVIKKVWQSEVGEFEFFEIIEGAD